MSETNEAAACVPTAEWAPCPRCQSKRVKVSPHPVHQVASLIVATLLMSLVFGILGLGVGGGAGAFVGVLMVLVASVLVGGSKIKSSKRRHCNDCGLDF